MVRSGLGVPSCTGQCLCEVSAGLPVYRQVVEPEHEIGSYWVEKMCVYSCFLPNIMFPPLSGKWVVSGLRLRATQRSSCETQYEQKPFALASPRR